MYKHNRKYVARLLRKQKKEHKQNAHEPPACASRGEAAPKVFSELRAFDKFPPPLVSVVIDRQFNAVQMSVFGSGRVKDAQKFFGQHLFALANMSGTGFSCNRGLIKGRRRLRAGTAWSEPRVISDSQR